MGILNLGDVTIGAAVTDLVITQGVAAGGAAQGFVDRIDAKIACSFQARFVYGSGGTSAVAIIETSLDQGQTWIEICRFDFATANSHMRANVGIATNAVPAAVAALSANSKLDGPFGDRLRCRITTVGVYAGGTTLSVRACPH